MIRLIILLGFFLTACTPSSTPIKTSNKTPIPQNSFTDISIDSSLGEQGQMLYEQNCKFCHQQDAIGKPGTAPSLTNRELLSIASNKFLVSTIMEGRPGTGMPPFSHLGMNKIKAIVAYLRSFASLPSRINKVEIQNAARGDVRSGKDLFERICITCHGPQGNGYRSGGTGTAIGSKGFLSKASDGFIRTTVKEGRSNTRMRGFSGPAGLANLTDQQIDNIIVYLRSLNQ